MRGVPKVARLKRPFSDLRPDSDLAPNPFSPRVHAHCRLGDCC
jgi:hypothetical protein